jgi:hypothetical protein
MKEYHLTARSTPGASATYNSSVWRMEIPAGERGVYRLAQFDDYFTHARHLFPHSQPCNIQMCARLSSDSLPGTWGFGLWNDPFGLSINNGGMPFRLPALPQAAWFFHGSSENCLTFHDDLPANGFFAGTFSSPRLPILVFTPFIINLPLLMIQPFARWMRPFVGKLIRQDGAPLGIDITRWHNYGIDWQAGLCRFYVDDQLVLETPIVPSAPLGLVIWIDNQYAAWRPDGRLRYGTLSNPAAWLEIGGLSVD